MLGGNAILAQATQHSFCLPTHPHQKGEPEIGEGEAVDDDQLSEELYHRLKTSVSVFVGWLRSPLS